MTKIWLYRWVFDPIHEWHYSYINSSISDLNIDNLKLIVKILWEKDPAASLSQRIEMIKIQIWENKIVDVIMHDISWHIQERLNFSDKYWRENIYQICWSDKIEREINMYWLDWDNFWVSNREWYIISNDLFIKNNINLHIINTNYSNSSTNIRKKLLENRDIKPEWLNEDVYNYILENDLYILNKYSILDFHKYWFNFMEYLNNYFPQFRLFKLNVPNFNNLQHKDWWKDKIIRYIVKELNLKWDILKIFFEIAYKFNY